ncbi:MAG: DUF4469 domain-containing protein [Anaerolineae bacterium]|nr:DUF4469 domain-containing protein [Anaerolineae bacterium]
MTANYKLYKSNGSGTKKYYAKIHYDQVMTEEDIIDEMIKGSPFSKEVTQAILCRYHDIINDAARNGKQVVTRSACYGLDIKGVFNGPTDQFDASRHEVVANVQPGLDFKAVVSSGVPIEKGEPQQKLPELDVYTNLYNGSPDTELSTGHHARILGNRLWFDVNDPQQGLFIIPLSSTGILNVNDAVKVEEFTRVTSNEIVFRVPDDLFPGIYKLEVRVKYGKRNLYTGELEDVLTVI